MLMNMSNVVTSRAILPGMFSGGMRKEMRVARMKSTEGKYAVVIKGFMILDILMVNPAVEELK